MTVSSIARPMLAALGLIALLVPGIAQDQPPQVERAELMETVGDNSKIMGDMVKGERPYDAAQVETALTAIVEASTTFITLFPEGSETGHETRALPAIWENKDDFDAKSRALIDAAEAAMGPASEGLDAFSPAFREVGQACRACHDDYRAEKD